MMTDEVHFIAQIQQDIYYGQAASYQSTHFVRLSCNCTHWKLG